MSTMTGWRQLPPSHQITHFIVCRYISYIMYRIQRNEPMSQPVSVTTDIPPQPSHTYLCLLAVQTPPEQSLTKPEPIPGLPDPSIAFLNSSAAFPKGCCTDVCLVSIPKAVNTISDEPKTSWIPSTNPKLVPLPLNPKTQYAQPQLGEAWTLSSIPDWVLFLPSILIIIRLSLPLSHSSCHSFPLSTLYLSSPYHILSYHYTSCPYLTTTPRPFLPGPRP